MAIERLIQEILENFDAVIRRDSPMGDLLWVELTERHPADIAQFCSDLDRERFGKIFKGLSKKLKVEVFCELPHPSQVECLSFLTAEDKKLVLSGMPVGELVGLFECLSDDDLKNYMKLIQRDEREMVLSMMQFKSDSVGGIMDMNVLTLMEYFTVNQCIQILQKVKPKSELHRQIFVLNRENVLVGHINIEDLVLKGPEEKIVSFTRKNELVARVDEDREAVAKKMVHYSLTNVPVVGEDGYFLGAIPVDTLVEIIEEEAGEDVYKMSAVKPIRHTYFGTSFFKLMYERSYILIGLLLLESVSTMILDAHESMLNPALLVFITLLLNTGGNASSQSSAIAIQGMASGEMSEKNAKRFVWREFLMSLALAGVISLIGFVRVIFTLPSEKFIGGLIVSLSLGVIVVVAIGFGSVVPFILRRIKVDPAFSAGPFLTTLMDILGVMIYCYISRLVL